MPSLAVKKCGEEYSRLNEAFDFRILSDLDNYW